MKPLFSGATVRRCGGARVRPMVRMCDGAPVRAMRDRTIEPTIALRTLAPSDAPSHRRTVAPRTIVSRTAPLSVRLRDEEGVALIVALMAMMQMMALGIALVMTTT